MADKYKLEWSTLQCPLCGAADQHAAGCALDGKGHVRIKGAFGLEDIDWEATLELNGMVKAAPVLSLRS